MDELSEFQRLCEARLADLASRSGFHLAARRVEAYDEIDSREPCVRGQVGEVGVWIFLDGAAARLGGKDWRFEREDYSSPDELARAFAERVLQLARSSALKSAKA